MQVGSTLQVVEADGFLVRVFGYFLLALVVLEILVAGAVLVLFGHDRALTMFVTTFMAVTGTFLVLAWIGLVIWHLTKSRLHRP